VRQRVMSRPEERLHLLGRDDVTSVQTVDPGQPGTDPDTGRLTLCGVVACQACVAALGRIQRRDLPGQVVVPRPCRQLMDRHRHTRPKSSERDQRSGQPTEKPENARGVSGMRGASGAGYEPGRHSRRSLQRCQSRGSLAVRTEQTEATEKCKQCRDDPLMARPRELAAGTIAAQTRLSLVPEPPRRVAHGGHCGGHDAVDVYGCYRSARPPST
jgi:hypothetical protein